MKSAFCFKLLSLPPLTVNRIPESRLSRVSLETTKSLHRCYFLAILS